MLVSGVAQLRLSGLRFETRDADVAKSFAAARSADARATTRAGAAGSALPSGRTTYRTYDDIQAELKQLVAQHPGLVRNVVFGASHQGRELSGVEIARDVDAADGRPVFFTMGVHHAREWPSAEAAMGFAQLLVQEQATARVDSLLRNTRIVILPLVNPDGYLSSRNAFDPGHTLFRQDPNVTLLESIIPPGGVFAYRRKNCNGEILGPQLPCELAWGVDNNRNYGNLWGGPAARPTSRRRATTAPARAGGRDGRREGHRAGVNIGLPRVCLTGEKPPLVIDDVLDATTTVPSSDSYVWHVNQSTRPFVGAAGGIEAYELTCEDVAGAVLEQRTLTIARGQDVTLNLGCGAGATTLSGGKRLGPAPPTGRRSGRRRRSTASARSSVRRRSAPSRGG